MQSSAYSLSHTLPTPNPRKLSHPCPSLHIYNHFSKAVRFPRCSLLSRLPIHNALITLPKLTPQPQFNGVQVKAADSISLSADHDDDEEVSTSKFKDTLVLGLLFGLWNIFNIYFNIYNKQVLKVFPYPVTVTAAQFAVGTFLVILMWTSNLYKRPKITSAQLIAILPMAVVHTLGNLFTNMSLGQVSVSFTHTIKAMEPFFSVVLSAMFLGEVPNIWIISSLVPIVGGVGLASMTEASFNWAGFWSAMASNLTNQSRNVLSKKFMVKKEESLDNITLFSVITIMSFILSAPVSILMEGVKFTPSYLQSAGLNVNQIYTRSFIAALCYHAYQQEPGWHLPGSSCIQE